MQHNKRNCGLAVSTQSQPKLTIDTGTEPFSQTASFKGLSFDILSFDQIILPISAIANPPTITRDVAGIEQDSQRILELWIVGRFEGRSKSTKICDDSPRTDSWAEGEDAEDLHTVSISQTLLLASPPRFSWRLMFTSRVPARLQAGLDFFENPHGKKPRPLLFPPSPCSFLSPVSLHAPSLRSLDSLHLDLGGIGRLGNLLHHELLSVAAGQSR
ncbi:hypothetical protein Landi51_00470 [Colletotrichum acutatum]